MPWKTIDVTRDIGMLQQSQDLLVNQQNSRLKMNNYDDQKTDG